MSDWIGRMRKVGSYIPEAHVLNELRVDIRFCEKGFDGLVDDEVERCVFEATSAAFRERSANSTGNDYIIGVFLRTVIIVSTTLGCGLAEP